MLRPRGLQARATVVAMLATLLTGLVLGAISLLLVTRVSTSSIDELLDSQVGRVKEQLARPDVEPNSSLVLEAVEAPGQVSVQVFDASGALLGASPGAPTTSLCAPQEDLVSRRVTTDSAGVRLTVCAAVSTAAIETAQHEVVVATIAVLPIALASVGVAVWLAVGRALRSVESLRGQADQMTSAAAGQLEVAPTGDEIERLGRTLNDLLGRLHAQARATRQFIADAGHELRNPLATMRVALEFGDADSPGTALALAELDRLEALVQDLLVLARTDAQEAPASIRVNFDEIVRQSVTAMQPRRPDVQIEARTEPTVVRGDARALRSAVDNLISNALRHARTRIDVTLANAEGACELHVDDDGTGLQSADCARVFDRFVRLDEARQRDEGGSGLGLAIVRAVAVAHGGTATAAPGPGGHFALLLPQVLLSHSSGGA